MNKSHSYNSELNFTFDEEIINLAIIGAGRAGAFHVQSLSINKQYELKFIVDLDIIKAKSLAKEAKCDYSDDLDYILSSNINCVIICTTTPTHYKLTIKCLEAGKHVLCEKPFALNAAEAFELYSLANKTGRTSMITHEFRWSPQRAYIQSLIDEGYLGELRLASLRLFFGPREGVRPRPATWALDASQGGGLLFALGSHYIDALRHWFGDVISVDARVWTHYPDRVDESKTAVSATADDTFLFTLDFENGGSATMHASSISPFGGGARIDLFGTEGTLVALQPGVNPLHDGKVTGARLGGEGLEELTMPDKFRPFEDERDGRSMPFRLLVREFVVGVETGTSPSPNFHDGWKCQQILDGVLESSRTGRRVPIR